MADDLTARLHRAAAVVEATPTNLGGWAEVYRGLADADRIREAVVILRLLGDAANSRGWVALALACAVGLRDGGEKGACDELVEAVAEAHCDGAARVKRGRLYPPPPPKRRDAGASGTVEIAQATDVLVEEEELSDDIDVAAERAVQAVESAAATLRASEQGRETTAPLVSALARDDLSRLAAVMQASEFAEGEVIIQEGQPAKTLFWLAHGVAEVSRQGVVLGDLRTGDIFGEIALLGGTTRTAEVKALAPSWLLEIPVAEVDELAGHAPAVGRELAAFARARLLSNVMRTSEIFSRLSEEERNELLPQFETMVVSEGDRVMSEGEVGEHLFVVVAGRCDVETGGEKVSVLEAGDAIGERALLAHGASNADVIAAEPVVLLALSRKKFEVVAVRHPALLAEVYKLLVEREKAERSGRRATTDLVF